MTEICHCFCFYKIYDWCMATSITTADFRAFSKIGDSESDSELQDYINTAESQISRICATAYSDIPDNPSVVLATKLLVLNYINSKSFPSKIIQDAVMNQCRALLGGSIDVEKQFILGSETA